MDIFQQRAQEREKELGRLNKQQPQYQPQVSSKQSQDPFTLRALERTQQQSQVQYQPPAIPADQEQQGFFGAVRDFFTPQTPEEQQQDIDRQVQESRQNWQNEPPLQEPYIDPTMAMTGAAGAAGKLAFGTARVAGQGLLGAAGTALGRGAAAAVPAGLMEYPIGQAADIALDSDNPEIALLISVGGGILSGMTIENLIERGMLKAVQRAASKYPEVAAQHIPAGIRRQIEVNQPVPDSGGNLLPAGEPGGWQQGPAFQMREPGSQQLLNKAGEIEIPVRGDIGKDVPYKPRTEQVIPVQTPEPLPRNREIPVLHEAGDVTPYKPTVERPETGFTMREPGSQQLLYPAPDPRSINVGKEVPDSGRNLLAPVKGEGSGFTFKEKPEIIRKPKVSDEYETPYLAVQQRKTPPPTERVVFRGKNKETVPLRPGEKITTESGFVPAPSSPLHKKVLAKISEETGSITLPPKPTLKERESHRKLREALEKRDKAIRAAASNKKNVDAEQAVETVRGMKDEAAEHMHQYYKDLDNPDVPIETQSKRVAKAIETDLHTPVENNRYSKAAVSYLKSGDFEDYVRNMPDNTGELTIKETEELSPEVAAMSPTRRVPGKRGKEATTMQSGAHVHSDVAKELDTLKEVKDYSPYRGDISLGGVKDIGKGSNEIQDIRRTANQIDGGTRGPVTRHVLLTSRDGIMARDAWVARKKAIAEDILGKHKITTMYKYKRVWSTLDGQQVKNITKQEQAAVNDIRNLFDETLEETNRVRIKRGQELIKRRENYITYIAERNMMDELLGRQGKPSWIMETEGPPDLVNPNKVFNPRELKRSKKFDAYTKEQNLGVLMNDYFDTMGRDIFYTNIIHNNKVHARYLRNMGKENAATAIETWTSRSFGGVPHRLDRAVSDLPSVAQIPFAVQRALTKHLKRGVFAANVAWNTLVQTTSHTQLAPRTSFTDMAKAVPLMFNKKYRDIVKQGYVYHKKVKTTSQIAGELGQEMSKFKYVGRKKGLKSIGQKLDTVADKMNFLTSKIEEELTMHAGITAYLHGKKKGLKGRELLSFIDDTSAAVNSMYNFEDLPGILQSKNLTAMQPFQTFTFEAMNNLREILGRTGDYQRMSKHKTKRLLSWMAGIYVANATAQMAIGRQPWEWESLIPFSSALFGDSDARYSRVPVISGAAALSGLKDAANAYIETGNMDKTYSWLLRWGGVPGGAQIDRIRKAANAWADKGRVRDKTGRVQYKMKPDEKAMSFFVGPGNTESGRKRGGKRMAAWEDELPPEIAPMFPMIPGGKTVMEWKEKAEKGKRKSR